MDELTIAIQYLQYIERTKINKITPETNFILLNNNAGAVTVLACKLIAANKLI